MASKKRPELAKHDLIEELPIACANEQAAVEFLEAQRWGDFPCCPECGSVDVYQMKDRKTGERSKRFLWRCRDCSRMYSVRAGTIYAESLIPLHKWCRALWESSTAKNGVSALEMSRRLQISYRSALFLMHRIRHAMEPNGPQPKVTGTVEADEMYWGGKARHSRIVRGMTRPGPNPDKPKTPIFAVVQRAGEVRARVMPTVTGNNVREAILDMADPSCRLVTDELKAYRKIGRPPKPIVATCEERENTSCEYCSAKNLRAIPSA